MSSAAVSISAKRSRSNQQSHKESRVIKAFPYVAMAAHHSESQNVFGSNRDLPIALTVVWSEGLLSPT